MNFVPLTQVATVRAGYAKRSGSAKDRLVEVPYLGVSNVQAGFMDLTPVKTMPVLSRLIPRFLLHPGEVLFTAGGDRDKLGRSAVWRGELGECLFQNHLFAVETDLGYINTR